MLNRTGETLFVARLPRQSGKVCKISPEDLAIIEFFVYISIIINAESHIGIIPPVNVPEEFLVN